MGFTALIIIISACSDISNPVLPEEQRNSLKSITKWQVDVTTNQKKSVVMYQEFDKNGRIVFNEEYNDQGSIQFKSTFTYIGLDKSQEITIEYDEAGNQKQTSINEYRLDFKGRVVKKISLNTDGEACKEIVYTYDELGNIVKRAETDVKTQNTVIYDYSYSYGSAGNLIERVIKSSNGNSFSRDSMVYNTGNSGLDIINYDNNGVTNIKSYKYNSAGRIITELESTSTGILIRKYIYEYSFHVGN